MAGEIPNLEAIERMDEQGLAARQARRPWHGARRGIWRGR